MAPSEHEMGGLPHAGRGQAGLVAHQQLEDEHAAQQEEDAVADGEAAEPQRVEADGGDAEPAEDQHRRDVAGLRARRRGLPLDPRLDGRRPSVRDVDGDPPTVAEAAPCGADGSESRRAARVRFGPHGIPARRAGSSVLPGGDRPSAVARHLHDAGLPRHRRGRVADPRARVPGARPGPHHRGQRPRVDDLRQQQRGRPQPPGHEPARVPHVVPHAVQGGRGLQRLAVQGRGVQGVGAARRHRRQRQHLQRRRAVAGVDRPGGRGHDGQRLRPDLRRAARERRPRAPDQDQGPAPGAGAAVRVPAGHAPPADHRHRGRRSRRAATSTSCCRSASGWRRTWPTRSSRSRRRSPRSTRRSAASTWASSWRPAAAPRC